MSKTRVSGVDTEGAAAPLVTVLMPVFNGERFLAEQIDSILSQDIERSVRLVALDDGSSDSSLEILEGYRRRDRRVEVLKATANRGFVASISVLLGRVDTPFFALADQDDVWDSGKLRKSVARLVTTGASLVYSDVRLIRSSGTVYEKSYWSSLGLRPYVGDDPVPFVFRNPVVGHTIVGTRELAILARPIPVGLRYHEVWIVYRASMTGGLSYVNEQLGSYRVHDANVVGPAAASWGARLCRGLRVQVVISRNETRRAALQVIAACEPTLRPIALALSATGVQARLKNSYSVWRFLRKYRGIIGTQVEKEVALYLLEGLFVGPGRFRVSER